ncbi:hypothetical protein KEM56_001312 [Ascosphaera pollenicola]|nr:hypothetical protein KEM56_001312 [Ascosphaera pollenicola]
MSESSVLRNRHQNADDHASNEAPKPLEKSASAPDEKIKYFPDGHGEDQLERPSSQGDEAVTKETKACLSVPVREGRIKKRHWLIFALGGLLGVLIAVFFADQNEVISLENVLDFPDISSLADVLPASILTDLRQFTTKEQTSAYDSFAVGLHLQSQGVKAQYPIVMIPGVISTGLESWGTDVQSRPYFRKRLWGSWSMMRALVLDKMLWKSHLMLDKDTGLDPPNIKLRAADGFDATDFFITGYWIWNKILENLATIGYDPTNAFSAPYDWRLSYINLETRDHYFSQLKMRIEMIVKKTGRKLILTSHSMGSQVVMFFFKWVEHPNYGGGGRSWVNDYIDSWINVSGCMLGTAKGLSAVLSGEMKDTAQLNSFALYGLERFLSREDRLELFRAMPGISSMLPKGGNAVWGNGTWAPDDTDTRGFTFGNMVNFEASNFTIKRQNMTVEKSETFLVDNSELWYQKHILSSYSHGVAHTTREVEENENDPRKWLNPLESRLPYAPDLKIYCFYGVGKPTERAYFYRDETTEESQRPSIAIDTTVTSEDSIIDHGVVMSEGDGTVNLLSLGYMGAKGWHMKRYNPANIKVTVYEMPHEPDRFSPRGGPNTGDHVDILGRSSLNDLILRIAGGQGHLIEDNFVSRIKEYADRVKIYEEEEPGLLTQVKEMIGDEQ